MGSVDWVGNRGPLMLPSLKIKINFSPGDFIITGFNWQGISMATNEKHKGNGQFLFEKRKETYIQLDLE